jgi:NAD(P)-dependent dehydrogenase (short-subunit alcohol dehydrogenase family)
MRGLSGRRILVGGSASGIGAATARRLAEEGAHVFLGDIKADGAATVAKEIEAAGGTVASGYYNLYDEASIQDLIATVVSTFGGLDGVANVAAEMSAGVGRRDLELLKLDVDVWERMFRANVIGTAHVMKYALPHLFEAGGGSIVNVTSGASHHGEPIRVAYGASKAAINSITRHVARTYGDRNVRANAVSPGAIMSETALAAFSEDFKATILANMPLKRPGQPLGQPADVARTIAFLLSDDADWISGQVWSVNAGGAMRD